MQDKECQWEAQDLWRKFERGLEYGRLCGRFADAEKCWRFFEGDQWNGIKNSDSPLPFYNVIDPVVNFKTARVAMAEKIITFSVNGEDPKGIMEALNEQVRSAWDFSKMEDRCWDITQNGFVEGTAFLYFHDGSFFTQGDKITRCVRRKKIVQVLPGSRVFLGNEEEEDLQEQPYIIIEERLAVRDVRREAKKNGVDKGLIDQILSDERSDAHLTTGNKTEQQGDDMTTCILYFERTDAGIAFCRCTKDVIFQPMQVIKGLDYYPLVPYVVARQQGKARGLGTVKNMIPNQIEINKTLVRRTDVVEQCCYPTRVYNKDMIDDASLLDQVGATIEMHDTQGLASIKDAFGYIQPAGVSSDVVNLENEMISMAKELAGAGDAALGNINPEQASGAAIKAVQNQADIPLNRAIAAFQQMVEDVAILWYHMIKAYNPTGYQGKNGRISAEEMKTLCTDVKAEVSSALPDTVYARTNNLYMLLDKGCITFEEFLDLADDASNLPIAKIKALRKENQEKAMEMENLKAEAITDEIQEEQELAALEGASAENDFFGMMEGGF
ncbi:MAG: hypothetical protein IJN80_05230 [Clostridia bacterium]|nr:hypothetical protein [Clostridia bacterium]